MAQPVPYSRHYNFTNFQTENPTTPLPGDQVDIEFNAVKSTLDQVITNLALIQRDDGDLANASVTPDTLSTATLNLIGGFTPRGIWATATLYAAKDAVTNDGSSYVAQVAHTSGSVFATDLAAGKWLLIAFGASSTASAFTPTGSTAPTTGMYLPAADTIGLASKSQPVLTLSNPASPVNYWSMSGAAAGSAVTLTATGSDSNISTAFYTKGTGAHNFYTNLAARQFQIAHTALAVNYLSASGGAVGSSPYLAAAGSDTDVGLNLIAQAAGYIKFFSNTSSVNFAVAPVASAVNYLQAAGAATGNAVTLTATGSDTNVGMTLLTKGTGGYLLATNNSATNIQLQVTHTASAVNYFSMGGAVTSNYPTLTVIGSDTNVGLNFVSKGTGVFEFFTNGPSSSARQLQIAHTASAVNYFVVSGNATASAPTLSATGSDTNVGASIYTKGTGTFGLYSHAGTVQVATFSTQASAVNYLNFHNNTATNSPYIQSIGSDTNVGMNFYTQGTGAFNFYSNASATQQFAITNTASAVNYMTVTGSSTGNETRLNVIGTDTNVGIIYSTKGTGKHRFFYNNVGTESFTIYGDGNVAVGIAALATNATAGFMWIPSSAGAPTGAASAPQTGLVAFHYDSTNNKIYVRSGGTWRSTSALT